MYVFDLCQNLDNCSCVDLFLGYLVYFLDLHIYFLTILCFSDLIMQLIEIMLPLKIFTYIFIYFSVCV